MLKFTRVLSLGNSPLFTHSLTFALLHLCIHYIYVFTSSLLWCVLRGYTTDTMCMQMYQTNRKMGLFMQLQVFTHPHSYLLSSIHSLIQSHIHTCTCTHVRTPDHPFIQIHSVMPASLHPLIHTSIMQLSIHSHTLTLLYLLILQTCLECMSDALGCREG